ncbi:MAG: DNA polymerase III subunit alpha [Lactobacillus sp.]|jgi:DNA polymerase-3 subunit alpha|nr:DNA polymerase III subunit alpha [Lactobacillus sp.]
MTEPQFIHLRVHSAYSLSEGAMKLPALISKVKEAGVPAVAVTDTANMFGAKAFSSYASKDGIKPILGCQFYFRNPDADDLLKSKGRTIEPDKIILLVKNEQGYMNIMELMKISYLDNPNPTEKPQLRIDDIKQFGEGLICLSGGVEGSIGRLLLENNKPEAESVTLKLKEVFGDRFYMEISRIGLEAEKKTEDSFIELAYKHNIPLVATNEAFFFSADMYEAHDALVCIAAGEYVANENRKKFSPNNRLKSQAEMVELFKDLPESVQNTVNIAKRCSYLSEFVSPLLPKYDCPDGLSENEYIKKKSREGLEERMKSHVYFEGMSDEEKKELDEKYFSRLDFEISVIEKMGFEGYFLIVADFINWSKHNNIPVGPGRGSGAGSIVAWSLKITDLDPIKWDLLFERFLNPDRISMPDFDVDFCQDKRGRTIEYVQNKYGFDKVAQIITYGKLQSKAVIRDVARVLQMPYSQADRISKMIPAGVQGRNPTLQEALDQVPELEEMRVSDPQINKLFDIAMKLEGLYRHSGVHAAGVVIGDRPLKELVPLYKDPKADMPVTQYDMKFIEETGLIKFDFLGLKTLTVIQKTVEALAERGVNVEIDKVPLDDKETYALLQRGDTAAVFQFESAGMKDVHKQIKPDRFEDLIAIVSLYRPGPMDNIPSYIKRKHGEEEVTYMHPKLEEVLAETYGIMVYQEQVMRISQLLAGYTKGEADNLRKAMGKKIHEQMAKHRVTFVAGCVKNDIEEATAINIFDAMEKFASYGFNKSHAAAYSLISYQTAYLKAHYPVEFMAAVMTLDITNTDKLLFFKDECKNLGISVLPPDINKSKADFHVEDDKIRYALSAVKGVGEAAMEAVVTEREKNGNFKNISDFIHRIDAKYLNRRQLEQLIKAGAFDSLDKNRGKLYDNVELILRHIHSATEMKSSSQASLFGGEELTAPVKLKESPDWPELEKLKLEAEAIGFYLSAHPLDSYGKGMERLGVKASSEVFRSVKVGDRLTAKLAGCVTSFQKRISKSGNKYAFLELSDANNSFEGILFSDGLSRYEDVITSGLPLLVSVTIDKQSEDSSARAMINTVETLDKAISEVANGLVICVNNISAVSSLKEIIGKDQRGKNKIYLIPENDNWDVRIELNGTYAFADREFLSRIRSVQGVTSVKEI